jgi:uncharacterized membrane protein
VQYDVEFVGYTGWNGLVDGFWNNMDSAILGSANRSYRLGIKKLTERGSSTSKHDPLDIARERYARGEITEEEFTQLKKNLS